ncbi:MAG: glycosyltransferase family 9 protein [Acidobacteriota bacterium]|nr:glycosyltransferase family 9 protein [Acidobacteriota bacterium]
MTFIERGARRIGAVSPNLARRAVEAAAGSSALHGGFLFAEAVRLRRRRRPRAILVICDVNLGDAILIQSFLEPVKEAFPDASLAYAYSPKAFPFIGGNPRVDRHLLFGRDERGLQGDEIRILAETVAASRFDWIVNFRHALPSRVWRASGAVVLSPLRIIANILRSLAGGTRRAHVCVHMNQFARDCVLAVSGPERRRPGGGAERLGRSIFVGGTAAVQAADFLAGSGFRPGAKKIMINSDASHDRTLIPLPLQKRLLEGVLSIPGADVILCEGYRRPEIAAALVESMPASLRSRLFLLPRSTPLDVWAALMDACDLVVSGDTGPLHMAAARKVNPDPARPFRNRTAVVGLFGPTSPFVYGYDSFEPLGFPAAQDAPAKAFQAPASCRSLLCMDDKSLFRWCVGNRCFDGLPVGDVLDYIRARFGS